MDAESIYQTLHNGPPDAHRTLLERLPDTGFGEQAASLFETGKPGMVIIGLVPVVVKLCTGIDPGVGTPLAFAAHRYAVELYEGSADHIGLLPMTLSNLATQYVNGCNLLGDSEATLAFTKQWIPYYTKLGERENLPGLKAGRINALLNLRRLEDAEQALADPSLRGNFATDIEIARLGKKLERLLADPTADRAQAQQRQKAAEAVGIATPEVETALDKAVELGIDDPGMQEQLKRLLAERLQRTPPADLTNPQNFDQQLKVLRDAEEFLTRGSGANNELTMRRRVREAAGIFVGRQPPPEQIRSALADLEQCLAWARDQGHTELTRDALWGIYLCRSRLTQPSEAADTLLQLRADLEAERAAIQDPFKRAGVFSTYPYLFAGLCEKLQQAGRTAELLEAIEAAKGRAVADILTRNAGRPVEDASIYSAVKRLPELTREHAFNYMTFFVDDERTYIAVVSKTGEVHAIEPVPLGRLAIREAAEHVDPRDGDAAQVLAPLVGCLDTFLADGTISPDDHLVYSPDEDLANVPLHFLSLGGKPLIDHLSVSRIHGAFHLDHVLAGKGNPPPSYFALVVPLVQNTTRDSWLELQRYLREPPASLQSHLKGETVEEKAATLKRFRATNLRDKILHFSAHGLFPELAAKQTPFENSGVVLATAKGLPDSERLLSGDLDGLLTPSKILDFKLDFTGSHVSIMTCVSGLSREGLGGDALGTDWACTQAGAASLLTSHWNVSAKVAAPLVSRFYDRWLGDGESRGAALRTVMTEFRAGEDPFNRPESWSAFSLTGDWR